MIYCYIFFFYYQYFLRGISHHTIYVLRSRFVGRPVGDICCFSSMMKFHCMCDSVMFAYRLHFMKTDLYDI